MRYAPYMLNEGSFIKLLADNGVIRFGEFKLKSGRVSPYFINVGQVNNGRAVAALGVAYAECIIEAGFKSDFIFGPSYKGVSLAVTTATALADKGYDVGFAFDRKEAKDHGERGVFVGTQPQAGMSAVIVDDVITSGISIKHSVALLRAAAVEVEGVVVAVDRQERGQNIRKTTLEELQDQLGVPVLSILNVSDIIVSLNRDGRISNELKHSVEFYLDEFGPCRQ